MKTVKRRMHHLEGIKNVLIIQLGDIGDIVWTIPTLRAVRETIPAARVGILLRQGFGSLLEEDPSVDKIFETAGQVGGTLRGWIRAQARLIRELRSWRFDLAVDLRAGDRGAFMALLSGAPRRVSLFYEGDIPFWRNLLFTEVVHPPAVHVARGAAEQSLRIVRELGIDTANALPMLEVSGHAVDRSRHILSMEGIGDGARWLSANPFSRWAYKELPEKKWVDLLQWLTGSRCVSVVLVGAPGERQKAEHLIRGLIGSSGERIVNLVGKTSLSELSGVLSLSRLHVGVDSAAPHIAAAVGTPTITVYGPTSWRDWAPIGEDHRVIASDLDCVPCRRKGCNGSEKSRCLEELDIEIIKKAIDEKLARAGKGP